MLMDLRSVSADIVLVGKYNPDWAITFHEEIIDEYGNKKQAYPARKSTM